MQKFEVPSTFTVDGKEYPISSFSEVVQRLATIHTEWRNQLSAEKLDVAKTEAALRQLDAELSQTVTKELAEKNKPAADTVAATAGAPAAPKMVKRAKKPNKA